MDDEDGLTALLGRALPPSFRRREVVIHPGSPHIVDESEWDGALVVVGHGAVEVETADGARTRFEPGAALTFAGLGARAGGASWWRGAPPGGGPPGRARAPGSSQAPCSRSPGWARGCYAAATRT